MHPATVKASLARVAVRQKLTRLLMHTSRPGYAGSLRASIRETLRAFRHIGSSPQALHGNAIRLLAELQEHGFTTEFMVLVRRLLFSLHDAVMELRHLWLASTRRTHKRWLRKRTWERLRREALRCAWED